MNFRHHFERLAVQISPHDNLFLRVLYLDGPMTLLSLAARTDAPPSAEFPRCLKTMIKLNLVETSQGFWGLSWNGYGVVNWMLQKESARGSERIPLPRPKENGYHPGPKCRKYRETLFRPGFCWCCRSRFEHFDQIMAFVQAIIRANRPQAL